MSWNIGLQVDTNGDTSVAEQIAFAEPGNEYQGGYAVDEAREQAVASKEVAAALINSGKFGEGTFQVNLGGHANEGHVPNAKWANEMVTVSISNTSERPSA